MSILAHRFAAAASPMIQPLLRALERLAPLGDLAIRLYVANVFWKSGLTKIASWDTTVMLFTHEYAVPLLSPELAAGLAIVIEREPVKRPAIGSNERGNAVGRDAGG